MKIKILQRTLCLILALCTIISIFPASAFATHEHISEHDSHCVEEDCHTCDAPVGEGITVALLDSGVQSYPVQAAVDFVGEKDYASHGDEMAEVLLENAPAVSLLDVRVLNAEGVGNHSDVAEGIRWATEHGAQIIVMSFAGLENSRILKEAVEYAAEMGVVMVAAAGNDMKNTATFPAAYSQVLSVGALDAQGQISLGSNSGAYVDLYVVAEGGTSHAAQVVAASIAKLMQERPEATSTEIYNELSTLVYKSDLLVEQSEDGTVYASALCLHKWGSWSTTRSATCTSTGQRVRYCSKCGKAKYDTISALGHSARSYYTTIISPTCTSEGSKAKYCIRCTYIFEKVTIEKLTHSAVRTVVIRQPTCTVKGMKNSVCACGAVCGTTLIDALGHKEATSVIIRQPTCTIAGIENFICRCGEIIRTTLVPAPGHIEASRVIIRQPTCTTKGIENARCCCGEIIRTTLVDAIMHDYVYDATENVVKCDNCGSIKGIVVDINKTRYGENKIIHYPNGVTEYYYDSVVAEEMIEILDDPSALIYEQLPDIISLLENFNLLGEELVNVIGVSAEVASWLNEVRPFLSAASRAFAATNIVITIEKMALERAASRGTGIIITVTYTDNGIPICSFRAQ